MIHEISQEYCVKTGPQMRSNPHPPNNGKWAMDSYGADCELLLSYDIVAACITVCARAVVYCMGKQ